MYTTVTKVRMSAGFVGNANVLDSTISGKIAIAENKVNSFIGDVYVLPLPKFYRQTIVFSGTGSGSATMTITIDGVSYAVAISSALTASQAADLFRAAASDSDSFVTDGLGSGATVTLYNIGQDSDSTDVTISSTNPQTVQGVTATGGTVTEIALPLLESITTEIAAARLLIDEYGPEAEDTSKDGFKRLSLAESVLKEIQKKAQKIFDFNGLELPRATVQTISFFPGDNSVDAGGRTVTSKFSINQQF